MVDLKDLKDINKILEGTPISEYKETIRKLFKKKSDDKKDIMLRLIVIDSLYSTNMNKRYFGFEELTDLIHKNLKDKLKKNINVEDFIKDNFGKMNEKIGIDKKGERTKGHAFSLLTKYIYFQTNFNFPIYDSLILEELNKEFPKEVKKKLPKKYFYKLNDLKDKEISFDDLDKYYWFKGKVKKGNLSLVIPDSETYIEKFINKLFPKTEELKKIKSLDLDKEIAKRLKSNKDYFEDEKLKLIQKLARKFNQEDKSQKT